VLSDGTFGALVAQWIIAKRNDDYGGSPGPASRINGVLKFITSTDGGETLTAATKVDSAYGDWRGGSSTIPSLAADVSAGPFKDRLYSPAKIVNDDRRPAAPGARTVAAERSAGMPAVAVNANGVVGVSWYDRRDNVGDDLAYAVRFAASLDGGETFTPSVRVSEKAVWWFTSQVKGKEGVLSSAGACRYPPLRACRRSSPPR